jgi:FkbM family methyltransferase
MGTIKIFNEHSVDVDLLTGGVCIDVGCRGFQFSEAMRDLGCEVVAFDMEDMQAPEGIEFIRGAVSNGDVNRMGKYIDTKDKQAKYLSDQGTILVDVFGINQLYDNFQKIDLLKLDVEGSEYLILSEPNFRPVPRQISVEFHMHCHRALHDQYYDKCMENLLKYYEPVQHELTQAHGAGWNYWDSLFVRRDLIT